MPGQAAAESYSQYSGESSSYPVTLAEKGQEFEGDHRYDCGLSTVKSHTTIRFPYHSVGTSGEITVLLMKYLTLSPHRGKIC